MSIGDVSDIPFILVKRDSPMDLLAIAGRTAEVLSRVPLLSLLYTIRNSEEELPVPNGAV